MLTAKHPQSHLEAFLVLNQRLFVLALRIVLAPGIIVQIGNIWMFTTQHPDQGSSSTALVLALLAVHVPNISV